MCTPGQLIQKQTSVWANQANEKKKSEAFERVLFSLQV